MRLILKYTVFAVFCSLLLVQTPVSAQETPAKTPEVKPTPQRTLRDLEIEFPDIEGWARSDIQKYPTAELGYSVNYESREGGRVTVYVYNGGLKNIPNDINSDILKNEINRAKNEIQTMGKLGYYENVREIKNDTITLGGKEGKIKALHSLFNFSSRGQDLTSEIFLFPYQDRFIKIRASRLKDKEVAENKALMTLFSEIDKLFSN